MERQQPTHEPFQTVPELSTALRRSQSTIRKWIEKGKLEATKSGRRYQIPWSDKNSELYSIEIRRRFGKPEPAYYPEELSEYSGWHEVLDELCWLFKVCYSPSDIVKTKKFRSDIIFANYIEAHDITLKKARSVFLANQADSANAILDDLKRGWYNELAYLSP